MTLYLIRGLPGSGKTTLVMVLADKFYEADQYFMETGEYKYDASHIADAHSHCQQSTEMAMKEGHTVAVSNTFVRRWEMDFYYKVAERYGYKVIEITLSGPLYGNVHGVPEEKIEMMRKNWER